jgi:outer membrane lipoprotein-sorting protein
MSDQRRVRVLALRAGAWLCAIALLLSPAVIAGQAPARRNAAKTFDELYARGVKANAGITTMTARFTETTTPSLMTRPFVERGMLYIERPSRRVALHYTDPSDRIVLIDGDRMITAWPSRQILDRRDIGAAQKRVQKYFESGDAAELRKVFDVDLREASRRPGTRELAMVPKRKQILETLAGLDLWIEESSGLLNAMRMTFSNGDTKLMEFTDVIPNAAIDGSKFSVPAMPARP